MKHMHMEGCEAPVTEAEIDAIEKHLGVAFPKDFRAFYLRANGGYCATNLFKSPEDDYPLNAFLPMKYTDMCIEACYATFQAEPDLPKFFVPFAIDGGGDFYGFSTAPAEHGKISLFSSDSYFHPEGEMIALCDTFTELIDHLVLDDAT
ncbi:SMI1/KNR4 family protein [Pseudomonas xanthosomatis]|uniref:SMI1/KNR4 family protein n=1 Tax=Pseudomonas xanthosomatis TaxID=2842356 RepID=UPI003514CBBD